MVQTTTAWHRLNTSRVEDLADAVHGAGMEATQMSRGKLGGSIVFAQDGDITYAGGLIDGRVALRGPLSPDTLSLGKALDIPMFLEGFRALHWLAFTSDDCRKRGFEFWQKSHSRSQRLIA